MSTIIIPPSAKRNPAFGNHRTMLVGKYTVVFDEEFDIINVVPEDDKDNFRQFETNLALDRYLDFNECRVRYHTVHLPMHGEDIDDYLYENGITIENKVEEPWNVEFSGSKFALMKMISDHWCDAKTEWVEFEKYVACIHGTTPDYNE